MTGLIYRSRLNEMQWAAASSIHHTTGVAQMNVSILDLLDAIMTGIKTHDRGDTLRVDNGGGMLIGVCLWNYVLA